MSAPSPTVEVPVILARHSGPDADRLLHGVRTSPSIARSDLACTRNRFRTSDTANPLHAGVDAALLAIPQVTAEQDTTIAHREHDQRFTILRSIKVMVKAGSESLAIQCEYGFHEVIVYKVDCM